MNANASDRFVLRNLGFPARLTLAAFLISVGIGYLAALVQLHLQHASPGNLFPTSEDARMIFHGPTDKPVSPLERVLIADESLPFGAAQMSSAFTSKSASWNKAIKDKTKELAGPERRGDFSEDALAKAEAALRLERQGERQALINWIRAGASRADYDQNKFCLADDWGAQPITAKYTIKEEGKNGPPAVVIKSLVEDRCVRCHSPEGSSEKAKAIPLDTYEGLMKFAKTKETGGMSLGKLAQTTHVHLLGFSMLYGLTGLLFALTSYPLWLRVILSPWVLVFQLADIGCWWLARHDPIYADAIRYTGMAVGAGLFCQIMFTLFDLFGKAGKTLLILAAIAATCGLAVVKDRFVDPYLAQEKTQAVGQE